MHDNECRHGLRVGFDAESRSMRQIPPRHGLGVPAENVTVGRSHPHLVRGHGDHGGDTDGQLVHLEVEGEDVGSGHLGREGRRV